MGMMLVRRRQRVANDAAKQPAKPNGADVKAEKTDNQPEKKTRKKT